MLPLALISFVPLGQLTNCCLDARESLKLEADLSCRPGTAALADGTDAKVAIKSASSAARTSHSTCWVRLG